MDSDTLKMFIAPETAQKYNVAKYQGPEGSRHNRPVILSIRSFSYSGAMRLFLRITLTQYLSHLTLDPCHSTCSTVDHPSIYHSHAGARV